MSQQLKVVYEDGVFKPLEPVGLKEHQQVLIAVLDKAVPTGASDQTSDSMPSEGPRSGPELATYWQHEGIFGSWSDIGDSVEHARSLRRDAERREH